MISFVSSFFIKDNRAQPPPSKQHDDDADESTDKKKKRGELQPAISSRSVAESDSSLTKEPSNRLAESNSEKTEDLDNSKTSQEYSSPPPMKRVAPRSKNRSERHQLSRWIRCESNDSSNGDQMDVLAQQMDEKVNIKDNKA